jgi:hypothetical protein
MYFEDCNLKLPQFLIKHPTVNACGVCLLTLALIN